MIVRTLLGTLDALQHLHHTMTNWVCCFGSLMFNSTCTMLCQSGLRRLGFCDLQRSGHHLTASHYVVLVSGCRHTLLMSQVWAAAPHYPQTVPQEAATHAADLHSAAMQMATLASASLAEEGDMTSTEQHAALQCDSAQQTASLNVMGDDVNPPTDRAQTTALSSSVFCQHCGGCAEYRQASSGALQTVQATKTACCCDPLTMSQPQKHQVRLEFADSNPVATSVRQPA